MSARAARRVDQAPDVAGTGWLLLGAVALTVALSGVVALAVTYASVGSGQDITRLSLTGVYLGQAIVAILAVLTIAGEYSSGMIRVTLTAMPRRPSVLAAKAAMLSALVVVAAGPSRCSAACSPGG